VLLRHYLEQGVGKTEARYGHLRSWFPEIAPLNIGHCFQRELLSTQRVRRCDCDLLAPSAANGRD
jgi:hypothetical protein